jgi:hypothetical protein
MSKIRWVWAAALVVALAAGSQAQEKAPLVKDGKLTRKVVLTDLQGGFAGFTGHRWTIEPSGKYIVASVRNERDTVLKKGELSDKQYATLAKELARYKLEALPAKAGGRPMANPHRVLIEVGKRKCELTLRAGAPLPKPDPKTVDGRFGGAVSAVSKVLPPRKGGGGADR